MSNVTRFPADAERQPVAMLAQLAENLAGADIRTIVVIVDKADGEWPDLFAYGPHSRNNAELAGHLAYAQHLVLGIETQQDGDDA